MFKRLFWVATGFIAGVLAVTKFRAYLKNRLSAAACKILDDDSPDTLTLRNLILLFRDFNSNCKNHEEELNARYAKQVESGQVESGSYKYDSANKHADKLVYTTESKAGKLNEESADKAVD